MNWFRLIVSLCGFFISTASFAATQWVLSPIAPEVRFAQDSALQMTSKTSWGAAIEARTARLGTQVEFVRSEEKSGNESLNVRSNRFESRLSFFTNPFNEMTSHKGLQFFVGGGVSVYQDTIYTEVLNSTDKDEGTWKSGALLLTRLEVPVAQFDEQRILASVDGKALFAKQLQDSPIWILSLKLGWQF